MKGKLFLLLIAGLSLLSASKVSWAHGNDITITGKVAVALVEEKTGEVYVLRPEEGDKLPDGVTSKIGQDASLYGNVYKKLKYKTFLVEEVR